jgi:UV excision repair protein RAD23
VQAFTVTVEESQTGAALKSAIHSAKGEAFEPSLLKVVHAGKILKDDDVLGTAGVKDGGFVVCMVSKPKVRACIAVPSVGVEPVVDNRVYIGPRFSLLNLTFCR